MAIYVYTGEGAGKTTNALGLALRSLGHGHKVIMIQFLKGREDIGEYKIQKQLKNYKVYQFGGKELIDLRNPSEKDRLLAAEGLRFVLKAIKQKPSLLILDEINIAAAYKILNTKDILAILRKMPWSIDIVMTGRYAPKQLIRAADYANEIRTLKMPKKMASKKGINY